MIVADKGDFRPWYVAIIDDPDFHEMSGDLFKVLFVLKMTLGAPGIGVVHMLVTAERCGCSRTELEERLDMLAQAKPNRTMGWIVRDRNIIWIVNGLLNERGLSPRSATHRVFVERALRPLGNKQIVRDFRSYYSEWFLPTAGTETGPSEGREGVSGGSSEGIEGGGEHKIPETRDQNPETISSGENARELARLLITRLNQGMQDNPRIGEAFSPVVHGHALSLTAAEEIAKAGVSAEFASAKVYEIAKAYTPQGRNRQISTLGYCTSAVIQAWNRGVALESASSTSRPAGSHSKNGNGQKPSDRTARNVGTLADWLAGKEQAEIVEVEVLEDGKQ